MQINAEYELRKNVGTHQKELRTKQKALDKAKRDAKDLARQKKAIRNSRERKAAKDVLSYEEFMPKNIHLSGCCKLNQKASAPPVVEEEAPVVVVDKEDFELLDDVAEVQQRFAGETWCLV